MDLAALLASDERVALTADALDAGRRLDRVLHGRVSAWASRGRVAGWIREGRATVDGHVERRAGRPCKWGERVELVAPKNAQDLAAEDLPAEIAPLVLRADGVVVVDKPAGLPVHPARGEVRRTLLVALHRRFGAESEAGGPWLCHRLDRETSGLLVVALTRAAARHFTSLFAELRVARTYAARVFGRPAWEGERRFDAPLRLQDAPPFRVVPDPSGQAAETRALVLRADADFAELEVRPVTGRQHQIRVHLASAGHPIVGDPFYGRASPAEVAPRMFLHACGLELPGLGLVESPAPWR